MFTRSFEPCANTRRRRGEQEQHKPQARRGYIDHLGQPDAGRTRAARGIRSPRGWRTGCQQPIAAHQAVTPVAFLRQSATVNGDEVIRKRGRLDLGKGWVVLQEGNIYDDLRIGYGNGVDRDRVPPYGVVALKTANSASCLKSTRSARTRCSGESSAMTTSRLGASTATIKSGCDRLPPSRKPRTSVQKGTIRPAGGAVVGTGEPTAQPVTITKLVIISAICLRIITLTHHDALGALFVPRVTSTT